MLWKWWCTTWEPSPSNIRCSGEVVSAPLKKETPSDCCGLVGAKVVAQKVAGHLKNNALTSQKLYMNKMKFCTAHHTCNPTSLVSVYNQYSFVIKLQCFGETTLGRSRIMCSRTLTAIFLYHVTIHWITLHTSSHTIASHFFSSMYIRT